MKPSYLKSISYTLATTALLLCSSHNQAQQYYKWIDANGSTHYTTTPPPKGAKRLDKVSTYGSSHAVKQNPSQQESPAANPGTAPQVPQVEPEVPANTAKPQTPPANTPQSAH
ncbi:DUF4124 domain-containing protein [Acinetobacter calcoaceticus]|uniref:DUF4124 domain-containing protein n=1 Tax=Acinetobacter calcoaceticus TaxID=471 RepID=UPI002B2FEA3C|nr:DUF4124 domain-containing protein [Acinetobacter baumannii]